MWRRALVYVHRWMGIAGGLLFVAWFVSGIVMMYARMPALPARDALERLAPIDLSSARVTPAAALPDVRQLDRLRITMLQQRPVYRVSAGRASSAVYADTGERVHVSADQSLAVVRELIPEHATTLRYDTLLTDADQWTMSVRAQMPMHRIAAVDAGGTYYYVTEHGGELVMRTTARERLWAYPGAVLHWLYFAPFRRQAELWTQTIIWLSIAGCVMCITGLIWGVMVARRSPYTGLMKWHHYAGLIFGATSLTFVFSGLLSMGPWDWSPGAAPTRAQRDRVAGGPLPLDTLPSHLAIPADAQPCRQLELQRVRGAVYAFCGGRLWPIGRAHATVIDRFPDGDIEAAAGEAMPDAPIEDMAWLQEYDNYYYARDGHLSLPVLRVRYADANRTWLYFDPRRGTIARKEERHSRVERWLYHGLHSFDFPWLYYRRPLWDVTVIALSVGGIVLSATTLLPGWRRLRRLTSRS